MVEKAVTKRSWSLEKFTKSVTARAKLLEVKLGSAAQIRKAYEDGWSVQSTVASFAAVK